MGQPPKHGIIKVATMPRKHMKVPNRLQVGVLDDDKFGDIGKPSENDPILPSRERVAIPPLQVAFLLPSLRGELLVDCQHSFFGFGVHIK